MANYSTTAQVTLSVNGKQAQQMLAVLQQDADKLRKKIDALQNSANPDKIKLKKLQQELNKTENLIAQVTNRTVAAEEVLRNLDKASPKELKTAIRSLTKDIEKLNRDSDEWKEKVENLKALKQELGQVQEQMAPDEGIWEKLNGYWEKFQLGITGGIAALSGLVLAGKAAVNAYAEMEQEMANVQKYTGMTEDDVKDLNEELKKIDTRTSREELNKLAQEAGRLGKTSQEEVLGFVRAADKINVALDDLGNGATLTLSKLTGIFGDEERLGTEKALLSVGSVINELSQNCSASAPYIAEFASRMGGVGAQAGMTVQQIMGFAAVLDSNNQKLEASSTALSQVIVRIYQDPAKYARVAGMDVEKFANLVKTDMNAALIEFLSTLKKAGNMDVLSPMFKDMGENGSRAISALSTLANHINEVMSQQMVANEAFEDATSIDKEFEVQNNTVQASLDKAKNKAHELAVELGEKLQPVMRLCISSSTIALKVLSAIVDFFIKYSSEIVVTAAALAAYNIAVNITAIRTTVATKATVLFNGAVRMMSGIIPAVKLAIAALTNTVQYFTNGLQVNYYMQQRWRTAMNAMKFTNVVAAVLAVATAIYIMTKRLKESQEQLRKEREEYAKIEKEAQEQSATQIALIDALYKKTQDLTLAEDERLKAIERLRRMYPDYFKDISNEAFLAGKAADAYVALKNSILDAARAKGKEGYIAKLEADRLDLEEQYQDEADYWITKKFGLQMKYAMDPEGLKNDPDYKLAQWNIKVIDDTYMPRINRIKEKQDSVARELADKEINKENKVSDDYTNLTNGSNQSLSGGSGASSGGASEDRFAKEKEWKEKEEAMSRIAYAIGESSYVEHMERMDEIEVEFYRLQLLHKDLTESERLKITAQWREAEMKQSERWQEQSLEEENIRYAEDLALLKQFYVDGKISKETYNANIEESEIEHQRRLVEVTEEGTQERLAAEQKLQSLLIAQMERRQSEHEKLEKQYAKVKSDYFGDNPSEVKTKYDAEIAMLDIVYNRELAAAEGNAAEKLRIDEAYENAKLALKKKYGLLSENEEKNAMQKAIDSSVEWLNSDGGKAVTGSLNTLVSGMSSIFSQLSSNIQAELEMQTAAIEKRYDKEIEKAEGNSYMVQRLEKQKEAEIASLKKEANRKMFAMQVIQAVAQTAINALNAYGSAAQVPVIGYILAPIAAAMAVAAGAIQIATIKKQQQASAAQGYMSGGFTQEGKADEVAGVVHKGEWVASQKLVNNPRTRPLLEALDYAQRTNRIGSITSEDVSRSIMAPVAMAASPRNVVVSAPAPQVIVNDNPALTESIARLNATLSSPIVAVASIAGDNGISKKLEDYERLKRNKSPKYRS